MRLPGFYENLEFWAEELHRAGNEIKALARTFRDAERKGVDPIQLDRHVHKKLRIGCDIGGRACRTVRKLVREDEELQYDRE